MPKGTSNARHKIRILIRTRLRVQRSHTRDRIKTRGKIKTTWLDGKIAKPIRGVAASERAAVQTIRRKCAWTDPSHSRNTSTPRIRETIAPIENLESGNHTDKI